MKKLTLAFFLSFTFLFSISQSKESIKDFKKVQIIDMQQGIILIPLLSPKDSLTISVLADEISLTEYNEEIVSSFVNSYKCNRLLFYFSEDLNKLYTEDDIRPFVFDRQLQPVDYNFLKKEIFIGEFMMDGYAKEPQYIIQKYKSGKWKTVSQEKVNDNEELSDYQKEINMFKPEANLQGILVKRMLDKEIELRKNRKFVVNFETYYPCHFNLPKEEVFKRLVQEMNRVWIH